MEPNRIPVIALACVARLLAAPPAIADCPAAPVWESQLNVTQSVSDWPFGQGLSFYCHGPMLRAVWNETGSTPTPHAGGATAWTWTLGVGSATLQNFPNPVPLSAGGEYVFVGATDGWVYKIDASTGTLVQRADTRRPSCAGDQLQATPAVVLYQYSGPTFQNAMMSARGHSDDLVIVATSNGCGDQTSNRAIAYYGSDLTVRWEFNGSGASIVGPVRDGLTIDYGRDRFYFGTDQSDPA